MYLKPKGLIANHFIAYLCAVMYIAVALLTAGFIISRDTWMIGVDLVIIVVLVILNFKLGWYISAKFEQKDNKLVYTVNEILDVFGHGQTRYEISSISDYKVGKYTLVIYGDIKMFEALQKGKSIKKVKIPDFTPETLEILKAFNI